MGRGARAKGRLLAKETATTTRGGRRVLNVSTYVSPRSYGSPQEMQENPHEQAPFSMRQEAQNTTERHQPWKSDLKLRHARVAFVSVGESHMDESNNSIPETDGAADELPICSFIPSATLHPDQVALPSPPKLPSIERDCDGADGLDLSTTLEQKELVNRVANMEIHTSKYSEDIEGAHQPIAIGLAEPVVQRSPSPGISDSSEEILVFPGRGRTEARSESGHTSFGSKANSLRPSSLLNSRRAIIKDNPVHTDAHITSSGLKDCLSSTLHSKGPDTSRKYSQVIDSGVSNISVMNRFSRQPFSEDEILADYIANIGEIDNSDDPTKVSHSILNSKRDIRDVINNSSKKAAVSKVTRHATRWTHSSLEEFDNLSTSSEDLSSLDEILSKRKRHSGVQYLIVEKGRTIADARWIKLGSHAMPRAAQKIKCFESNLRGVDEFLTDNESADVLSDGQIDMDLQEDLDDILDEQDLLNHKMDRMTDGTIARLLSKQEELGLGSSDLLLFDGYGDGEEYPVPSTRRRIRSNTAREERAEHKRMGNNLRLANSPLGPLVADPYDGFDVMDRERPSLRLKLKGRRGMPNPEPTDTDVEKSFHLEWEKDRAKKNIRKQEREELRAQGLLGKSKKPDLKYKYSEGMSLPELKDEIRVFLLSSEESLSLPPMDHQNRKMVHEIANVLKLKSKSIGSGKSRFPILYKTSRTAHYDGAALSALEVQMNFKRFVPRHDKRTSGSSNSIRRARGGGFNNAAVSYKDGEIVGAAAPELGQENKGRAMLEKMGWSTGTALGAVNNKGIMQPVMHVVKTTKAGLG